MIQSAISGGEATDRVVGHFTARAERYDESSNWCTDRELLEAAARLAEPAPSDAVLDVAVGTGQVAKFLRSRVKRIVGVDITPAMANRAKPYLDELHIAPAESLPLPTHSFDIVVCRQGIQFMDLGPALAEMVRVAKPGGRILLIDLCAYDERDAPEYFEILRLRNPVRRNFFVYGEVAERLRAAGCPELQTARYVSREDVELWSDNGAIGEGRRQEIREVYAHASPAMRERHSVRFLDGRYRDDMLFSITMGRTARAGGARP